MERQKDAIAANPNIRLDGAMPAELDLRRALLCCELSQVAYRHHNRDGAVTAESLQIERQLIAKYAQVYGYEAKVLSTADQQAVIFYSDKDIIVAFEGSNRQQLTHYNRNLTSYFMSWFQPAADRIVNAAQQVMGNDTVVAKVHWGFDNALNQPLVDVPSMHLWDAVKAECNRLSDDVPRRKLYFTGHSSGGAIATIATSRMLDQEPDKTIEGLYTFGQPRVGGKYFRAGMKALLGENKYWRFEQYGDPMPALPPYTEEEYVHGGQWIPMDLQGHVLRVKDEQGPKDTLSHTNSEWNSIIGRAYRSLAGAMGAVRAGFSNLASSSIILRDLFLAADPIARETHSSLKNLFSPQNYEVHRCAAYSIGLHNAVTKQSKRNITLRKELAESEGQGILYQIQSFDDFLLDAAGTQLPEEVRTAIHKIQPALAKCLNEWQRLRDHQPDMLKGTKVFAGEDNAASTGILRRFWSSPSETPAETDSEKALFENKIRSARQVRRWQRASRVDEVHRAINQLRHEIAPYVESESASAYIRELGDLADRIHASTAGFSSRITTFNTQGMGR